MKWMRIEHEGAAVCGLLEGDEIALTDVLDLYDVLAGKPWNRTGARVAAVDAVPMAPIVPRNIICVGLNYYDHALESNMPVPETPMIFAKFTNTIAGDRAHFSWKSGLSDKIDYEAELGVVIGRPASDVSKESAMDHVFGYVVANDLSARDIQLGDGQWVRGKSLDGSCPIGPALVTCDEIPDVHDLSISCRVNGETVQESNTSKMIFSVGDIISFLSQSIHFQPGDLILTGTPHGVGQSRPTPLFLGKGDVVEVSIAALGTLTTFIDGERAGRFDEQV